MELKILLGDNIDLLKQYPDNYFDSVVTDCPYGLGKEPNALKLLQDWIDHGYHEIKGKGFMGKSWDAFVPQPLFWKEVFRVLKPGGYVLAFFGTRTYDWGTLAIRLVGFEIRDMICWHYGSGFPKSLDISRQIDKTDAKDINLQKRLKFTNWFRSTGLTAIKINELTNTYMGSHYLTDKIQACIPIRSIFDKLKPLINIEIPEWVEDFVNLRTTESQNLKSREVVKKVNKGSSPLAGNHEGMWNDNQKDGDFNITKAFSAEAKQWDGWGTALKPATEPICVARKPIEGTVAENILKYGTGGINLDGCAIGDDFIISNAKQKGESFTSVGNGAGYNGKDETCNQGRFPANVIFDPFMADELDQQSGELTSGKAIGIRAGKSKGIYGDYAGGQPVTGFGDTGGASRFFYCAKASQFERNAGCDHLTKSAGGFKNGSGRGIGSEYKDIQVSNFHPTVKPISLMSYLQRLVTPPGGKTLDPFAGSGTSGCSAYFENIGEIVLMEMDETYLPIIEARTKYWSIERNRINYLEEIRVKKDEPIENQMKLF